MKKFLKEQVLEDKHVLDEWCCDLCQADLMMEKFHPHLEGESLRGWEQSIDIMRTVESPNEEDMAFMDIDMCGKCWDEKLIPWLKANGFGGVKYEKSWEQEEIEGEEEHICEECEEENKKNIN